jgi:hypothetical protein
MSFFEPLPPPPSAEEQKWAPPAWDRPSEGVLPELFAVNALLHQNDDVAIAIDRLEVYPNGFTICLAILYNPDKGQELSEIRHKAGSHIWPRIGVRFADGRTAGRSPVIGFTNEVPKDKDGFPVEPFIRMVGGGGGGSGWRTSTWVYPLPPDGPLEVIVGLDVAEWVETSVTLDGTEVRAAAEQAKVMWN